MSRQAKSYLPSKGEPVTRQWLFANARFQERYPALFELLALARVDGGDRKGATVTLFAADGLLKCCVADRETGQLLWINLEATGDVLDEIEALIETGKVAWTPAKGSATKPVF